MVGTDGLFDNLFDEQIIKLVDSLIEASGDIKDPEKIADVIANEAEKYGADQSYLSPFAKAAR